MLQQLILSPALRRFLSVDLLDHVQDSFTLVEHFEEPDHHCSFHDYSFVVFPIAKAYEGFLKQFFVQTGALSPASSHSRHFRIGRSFNPDLPPNLRDEVWIFDDVQALCGTQTARDLWQMWVDGRNHPFHYFADERYCLTYPQAKRLVERFVETMEKAMACYLARQSQSDA